MTNLAYNTVEDRNWVSRSIPLVLTFLLTSLAISGAYWLLGRTSTGDVLAFAFWTLLLVLIVAPIGHLLGRRAQNKKLRSMFVAMFAGLVIGFFYTVAVSLLLGPQFRAFSLPVAVLWMAGTGAYFAFVWSPWATRKSLVHRVTALVLMNAALAFFLIASQFLVGRYLWPEQQLTIVFAEYTSEDEPLHFSQDSSNGARMASLTGLLSKVPSSIRGELRLTNCVVNGNGPRSVAFILFPSEYLGSSPFSFTVKEPFEDTVVYRFEGNNWTQAPANAVLSRKVITLYRESDNPQMLYLFEDRFGALIGGQIQDSSWELRQCRG